MTPQGLVAIVCGLGGAVGLPMYYALKKSLAASSLKQLVGQQFSPTTLPVAAIKIANKGQVQFFAAYKDDMGSDLVLLIGNMTFGLGGPGPAASAYLRVPGLYKPRGDAAWLERVKGRRGVVFASLVEGGALVVWKGLPSRGSILPFLEALR